MSIYNLILEDKRIIDIALLFLAQTYDQHKFETPTDIFRVRERIIGCSTVQLITDSKKRSFADEA